MARKSIDDIRKQIQADTDNKGKTFQGDNASYPFWMIPEGSKTVARFLPDGDESNDDGFWVERLMINLDFTGIEGDSEKNFVRVQVPCVEMFKNGVECPIQADIKPWYKDAKARGDDELEKRANSYWKKRTFLYQGFVSDHPGFVDKNGNKVEDNFPENPIRRFVVNPNLNKKVQSFLNFDPQLAAWPDDYDAGLDFTIRKTKDGKWADYDTSDWARASSALTDEQRAAIDEYGLFVLKDFLPRQPTEVDLKVIMEMFEASVDGQKYDPERWGSYYRPQGMQRPEGGAQQVSTPASTPKTDEVQTRNDDEAVTQSQSSGLSSGDRAKEILDRIHNRPTVES